MSDDTKPKPTPNFRTKDPRKRRPHQVCMERLKEDIERGCRYFWSKRVKIVREFTFGKQDARTP